ncbi:MAG: hypothetical protein AB7K68_16490 [Bacteriovoracia bacterium]
MTIGVKIVNSLARNSLRAGLLCLAASSYSYAQSLPSKNECEGKLTAHFNVLERNDSASKFSPAISDSDYTNQLKQSCTVSQRSLLNQHLADLKATAENDDDDLSTASSSIGACEYSYGVIKEHFNRLKKEYTGYCEKIDAVTKSVEDCRKSTGDSVKQCIDTFHSKQKEAEDKFSAIAKDLIDDKKLLDQIKARRAQNVRASDAFKSDRYKLAANPLLTADQLENAGGFEISEYKQFVSRDTPPTILKRNNSPSEGKLIDEQNLAADNVEKYLAQLSSLKGQSIDTSRKLDALSAELKRREERLKTEASPDLTGKALAAAPFATAATAAITNKTPTVSPGVSSSGSSALPVVAALGLAGAAAKNSGASSSGSMPPPTLPSLKAAPPPLAATAFGGSETSADKNTVKAAEATKEEKKSDPAPLTAGLTSSFGADGSSRTGTLKRGAANAGTAAPTTSSPGESYANTGGDFGSMPSRAPSSRSTTSAAGEVTNLLGQMKSLFDFGGEGAGTGGPEAAFGGGAPNIGGAVAPASEALGEYAEAATVAPSDYQYTSNDPEGDAALLQSADLAILPESLFVRVHKRHKRCQELGLLVVNLGGIR